MRESLKRILLPEKGSIEETMINRGCHPSATVEMRDLCLEKGIRVLTPFAKETLVDDGKSHAIMNALSDPWYVSLRPYYP